MTNCQIKIPNTGRFPYFTQVEQLLGNIFLEYAEQFLFSLVRPSLKYDIWYGWVKIYHANPNASLTMSIVSRKRHAGLAFYFRISDEAYGEFVQLLQTACQIQLLAQYDFKTKGWYLIINPEYIKEMPERGTVDLHYVRLSLF